LNKRTLVNLLSNKHNDKEETENPDPEYQGEEEKVESERIYLSCVCRPVITELSILTTE
jgi:hypothetical protein